MRDGIGKPVFHTAPRARGCDLDPVCELPYRPAATERPQQRPNRCQHLTTRTTACAIPLMGWRKRRGAPARSPPAPAAENSFPIAATKCLSPDFRYRGGRLEV